ncbi:MAG TPA: hypothetical protein VL651_10550 [Bacteroidia bacterium]|jgi:hypothetical protein|nr:hypothetical protein [Bacteroidia bacterium]
MRNYFQHFSLIALMLFAFCSCDDTAKPGETTAQKTDSVKKDSIVMKGHGDIYPYKPDTMYNELLIGSISSFREFWKAQGAELNKENDSTWYCLYTTNGGAERVQIWMVKDDQNNVIPYAIDIRKYHDELFKKNVKSLVESNHHIITGHGIYIGMSTDYVMTVYTDQKLKRTVIGDTVCLEYQPQKKDATEYKRYVYSAVTARYKFVDDYLRRIEYVVDPKGFINTK